MSSLKGALGFVKFRDAERGERTVNCVHFDKGFLIVTDSALSSRTSIDSASFHFGNKHFSPVGGRTSFSDRVSVTDASGKDLTLTVVQIKLGRFFEHGTYEKDWENWEKNEKRNVPPGIVELQASSNSSSNVGSKITIFYHNATGELKSSDSKINQIDENRVICDLGENSAAGGLVVNENGDFIGIHSNEGICLASQRIKTIIENRNSIYTALQGVAFRQISVNRARDGINRALEICRKHNTHIFAPIPKELCNSNDSLPFTVSWPEEQNPVQQANGDHHAKEEAERKAKEEEQRRAHELKLKEEEEQRQQAEAAKKAQQEERKQRDEDERRAKE